MIVFAKKATSSAILVSAFEFSFVPYLVNNKVTILPSVVERIMPIRQHYLLSLVCLLPLNRYNTAPNKVINALVMSIIFLWTLDLSAHRSCLM